MLNWIRRLFRSEGKRTPLLVPWSREEVENIVQLARRGLERAARETLRCPDCRGDKFLERPSDGACTNIKCDRCGATFNHGPAFLGELLERISDAGPTIWGPHHSYNKGTAMPAPKGFEDKAALLEDGWAVRFNGAIESARWHSRGGAEAHLILLQKGVRRPQPASTPVTKFDASLFTEELN